jgi:hypothetical protein
MTLARGLLDEQTARKVASLTPAELANQAQWQGELASLHSQILFFVTKSQRTESENKQLEELIGQRNTIEQRLADFAIRRTQQEVASADAIRASLSKDAALLFWIDLSDHTGRMQEHWGCVVRATGEPEWERLPGTGPEGHWMETDVHLPAKLRSSLAGSGTSSEIAALAKELYTQRLAPRAASGGSDNALRCSGQLHGWGPNRGYHQGIQD